MLSHQVRLREFPVIVLCDCWWRAFGRQTLDSFSLLNSLLITYSTVACPWTFQNPDVQMISQIIHMKERGAGSTPPNLKVPAFLWAIEYLPVASDPNIKWTGADSFVQENLPWDLGSTNYPKVLHFSQPLFSSLQKRGKKILGLFYSKPPKVGGAVQSISRPRDFNLFVIR